MADNEKDVPIKEQNDGSVLARVEVPEQIEDDEVEVAVEASDEQDEEGGQDEDHNSDDSDDGEFEEDREKIREARREERKLKKELAKQREASAKHKISALEKRNEDLARRLAAVEDTAAS